MINCYITTKYGIFEVTDNGSNGTILSVNGNKIYEFPKSSWWGKDNIEKALVKKYAVMEESNSSIGE